MEYSYGVPVDNSNIERFGEEASHLVNTWNKTNTERCCVTLKIEINEGDKKSPLRRVRLLVSFGGVCSTKQIEPLRIHGCMRTHITLLLVEFDRHTRKFMAHNPTLKIFDKKEFSLQDFQSILDVFSENIIIS